MLNRLCDLRYAGQSYELTTPFAGSLANTLQRFHTLHEQRFGHSHPEQSVQVVALRVKALLQPPQPELPSSPLDGPSADHACLGSRPMIFAGGKQQANIYDRAQLRHGNRISGPALLVQSDSTFLLPPNWEGSVDAWGNINAQLTVSHDVGAQLIRARSGFTRDIQTSFCLSRRRDGRHIGQDSIFSKYQGTQRLFLRLLRRSREINRAG